MVFSVSDVTSVTRLEEKQRPKSQPKTVQQTHLLIPYTHEERLESFESSNLNIHSDPIPDGSCQFAAVADQLATIGIFRSASTLREEIVADLTFHPHGVDGTPLSEYVAGTWGDYLQRMAQHGTYGDHITLQRASQIFNVQFVVVSTLGLDATSVISPSGCYCESLPLLVLGHFAEGHGEHYVSLNGPIFPYIQAIQEAERHRLSFRKPDRTPTGVDPQPGPLADPEPGILADPERGLLADPEPGLRVDLEPYLLANPEPGPVTDLEPGLLVDLEPGPLAHPEPGPLANPEVQSMANPLVDMVVNPDNEHGAQYLPSEIL